VEALARRTALSGVAMFEFRHHLATGAFILLEVNARFWGSLPLAIAAGADFPADLARLLLGGARPAQAPYRMGLRRRDLGGEYYRVLKAGEAAGGKLARLRVIASGLSGLAAAAVTGRGTDSHSPDDPFPWRAERKLLLARIGGAVVKRIPLIARRRARAERSLPKLRQALRSGTATVVVLCHGNICRSPFAAALLETKAASAGLHLAVRSAGTIPLEGRTAPARALAAAGRYGIDLTGHRSAWFGADELERADAVLLFDETNVEELKRLGARPNIIRLGDLLDLPAIADPYGRGAEAFEQCYDQIDRALDRLVERLA
jgi:protein-tyrosine-phosphatase